MTGAHFDSALAGASSLVAVAVLAAALVGPSRPAQAADDVDALRVVALAALVRARAAGGSDVVREVTLPSIERLVEDADLRRASITKPARDEAFVRDTLTTARDYAGRVAKGDDPYRTATGELVKAYRASFDGTLQPYALYVPRGYDGQNKKTSWPLIVALHGAFSDHKHNLRRVFGLDNRPGETDAEASRNQLPLPDLPAFVVSPLGRGELMGYDGLGYDDVMRVLADVRRAYHIDPDRITLTGLSMGGGGTWAIGLRHPELFAALAPVCAIADFRRMVKPADAALYDLARLDALSPPAIAENAARQQVFIFHGDKDPTVPVEDSRKMVARFKALGFLDKNVHYTEYPGVGHPAWIPAYKDAELLKTLAAIKRDPAAPRTPLSPPPPGEAIPGMSSKSVPRQRPHLYVYGTNGPPEAVAAAKALAVALGDWGPMVAAKFAVKGDREVTAEDRARFNLVLVGAAPLNALAGEVAVPLPDARPLGDRAFRAVVPDPRAPSKFALVMGALTPRGFARLQRFARHNRDAPAPESNRAFTLLEN
ncbi:MAG TPA: prolyl oligopeptidase family serine peptidase [Polyangia bacterium]|jgi:poly(3-hydroxybutyrate) depolymerase|nr:prolyl oligopeptidase family serine peptidase [Polyangia bacterium]